MDPVSAIGLVGSLVGISDVASKGLRRLINLQARYRSASLTVSLLIGQLTTLKAAVNQITEWVTASLVNVPRHEQLVEDLGIALESCKLLITVLDERTSQLERDSNDNLSAKGKAGFLWEESEFNEFTNHLNNQVNALNLLLTALNCRTAFERNALLQDDESRRIIKRVEDNRESLLSLRDSASERTKRSRLTEDSHILDTEFDFDNEIVNADVYRAALRSNLLKAARRGKAPERPGGAEVASKPVPEMEEITKPILLEEKTSDPGPSHMTLPIPETTTQIRKELLGFRRWFSTNGAIVQTTEVDRTSSRLSRRSSILSDSDVVSMFSNESVGEGDEQKLNPQTDERKSVERVQDRRTSRLRVRKIFKTRSPEPVSEPASEPLIGHETQPSKNDPFNVLLLGSGNSGKSTLFKSIDAFCKGGRTTEERLQFQDAVFTNVVQNMKDILQAMEKLRIHLRYAINLSHVRTVMSQPPSMAGGTFPSYVCEAIETLWMDAGVKETFERSSEYILQDAAAYFLDSVRRISEPGYIPTDEDIIMVRVRSTGLYRTTIQHEGIIITMTDTGGERSERKKWIHAFKNVNVLVFLVDMSAYDLMLWEDDQGNRFMEDLMLFESICNSHWFEKSQILLLFTKEDIFKEKVQRDPFGIRRSFTDFAGREDSLEDIKAYLEHRFLALNRNAEKTINTMFTSFIGGHDAPAKSVLDTIIRLTMPEPP